MPNTSGVYSNPEAVGWVGWIETPDWIAFVGPDGESVTVAADGSQHPSVPPDRDRERRQPATEIAP